jgi:heptosyltransferase-2
MIRPKTIAVFLPNWIGDMVMATPAVRALRERFPDSRLIGVRRPYVHEVLDGLPWLDQCIDLDPRGRRVERWPAVAAALRREQVDLAVLFPNSFHAALVAWAGRCRRRVGFARYARQWLLTDVIEPVRGPDGRPQPTPIIDAYNDLARAAGCSAPDRRMELRTSHADEHAADQVWKHAGIRTGEEVICLNPGAAFGAAKHWPAASFAALARQFAARRKSRVLVLCGPKEKSLAREIVHQAGSEHVYSLADHGLSIGLTKACVRRADLLVTTDSGPRHFAAAFNRPVVSLFGPTHIAWTETFHPKAVHLQKQVACGPCQLRVCPLDHRCMTSLTPDEVYRTSVELLGRWQERLVAC